MFSIVICKSDAVVARMVDSFTDRAIKLALCTLFKRHIINVFFFLQYHKINVYIHYSLPNKLLWKGFAASQRHSV